jgi:RimJ/RimL family protein N-acetyltransferase
VPEVNEYGQPVGDLVAWSPRRRPEPVTLPGAYVVVEPLAVAHAPALHAALCGPGDRPLWTYRPTEPPRDVGEMAALIEVHLAAADLVTFALVPRGERAEGIASYMRIDPATGQVEIAGVLFSRRLQRTRAATEAIHLTMRYAFDDLGYRRFEWKCDSLNEPSRRAARRLGFRYEGRFRQHMVTKSRNRDTDWFSVTDGEWRQVRAAHEAWLDPDNFDATGRQHRSLSSLTAPLFADRAPADDAVVRRRGPLAWIGTSHQAAKGAVMSDQSAEDPLEPVLDPGLPHRRSEHGGMPPRSDEEYELAAERDRVAAGLADYVPQEVPPATDPVEEDDS